MADVVLDASAALAVILREPGTDQVIEALRSGASMSAVNVAEVAARLHQEGWGQAEVALVFAELGIQILSFDSDVALLSGRYRIPTRHLGLGLGDRACLATAFVAGSPALTADRAWVELEIEGVDVLCIR